LRNFSSSRLLNSRLPLVTATYPPFRESRHSF